MSYTRIHGLQGGCQPRTTIGDNQLQLLAFQAPPVQIPQQTFPSWLALSLALKFTGLSRKFCCTTTTLLFA